LRGALGLALGATLGIPRLSVRAVTVCVGADRLTRAFAARRQRQPVGAKPGRTGLGRCVLTFDRRATALGRSPETTTTARTAAEAATTTTAGTTAETATATTAAGTTTEAAATITTGATRATWAATAIATRTTGSAEATSAARTTATGTAAGTASTTAITITAGTTRTTTATRATTSARTFAEIARCRGELPADARTRHLSTSRTIVVGLLFLFRTELEAAEAARLRGTALAAESTAAAATATATTATAITTTATAAIIATFATTLTLTGDAIDHEVKLAALDRTVRAGLALEHANEANLIDAIADDVERLDDPRRLVGLQASRLGDCLHDRIVLGGRRGLGRFGLHRLGLATLGLGRCRRIGCRRIRRFCRRCRRGFATVAESRLAHRRSRLVLDHRRRCRVCGTSTGGGTSGRGLAEGQRREFGERLHGRLGTPEPAETLVARDGTQPPPPTLPEADAETLTETDTLAWMCVEAFAAAAI